MIKSRKNGKTPFLNLEEKKTRSLSKRQIDQYYKGLRKGIRVDPLENGDIFLRAQSYSCHVETQLGG